MHNHKYLYTICICICVLFSKRIALWLFLLSCVNLASRNVYKIVRIISIRSWDRVGVAFSKERVCEWMHCLDEWIPNLLGNTTISAWMKSEDGVEGGGQRVGSSGICIPSTHVAHAESSAFLFPFKSGNLIPFVATQLKFHLFNLLNTYIPFGVLFLFLFCKPTYWATCRAEMCNKGGEKHQWHLATRNAIVQHILESLAAASSSLILFPRPTRRMRNLCSVPCVAEVAGGKMSGENFSCCQQATGKKIGRKIETSM